MKCHQALIFSLAAHEQRKILYAIIGVLSKKSPVLESSNAAVDEFPGAGSVGGIAALIGVLFQGNHDLQLGLIDWLVGVSAVAPAHSHIAHRAVITTIATSKGE